MVTTRWSPLNPADETQNFIFRLNYVGGHYLLPIQLGPKATRMFNVSDVIRSAAPDAEGNVIPPNVQEGSAVLMGSKAKIEHIVVAVDAATYNVKKATCGGNMLELRWSQQCLHRSLQFRSRCQWRTKTGVFLWGV